MTSDKKKSDGLVFDNQDAIDRVDGDINFLAELTLEFLKTIPSQLEILREAANSADSGKIEKTSHSLKGALRNLGAVKSAESAFALELAGKNSDLSSAKQMIAELEMNLKEFENEFKAFIGQSAADSE